MSEPEIDFLAEEVAEEVLPEVTPAPETVAETVVTPETPAPVAPTAPEPHEERVPLAALKAEREKRQQYERELAAIRQKAQEQPLPKFYEAPEQYVQTLLAQERQQMHQSMVLALEAQAREMYPDYDEVFAELEEQAADNPMLAQQVFQAPNPAMAAYKLGKQLRELKQMKDPDAYRTKIEAEVRAKVEAEFKAKEEARLKAASAIPPDLTAARASRDDEVLPEDDLDSILKSKR